MEQLQSFESLSNNHEPVTDDDVKEIKIRPKLAGKRCDHCGELFRGPKIEIHAIECKFIPPGTYFFQMIVLLFNLSNIRF